MRLTYAVPDLHGSDDLLDKALAAIEAHEKRNDTECRTLVFLGDYIDRGPNSRQVLDRLMVGPPACWRWICLRGNHEQMMLDAARGIDDPDLWESNGGAATLRGFALSWRDIEPYELPPSYLAWIEALPLMHADHHRVFVHAGVDPHRRLDDQTPETLLWSRSNDSRGHGGLHIVHGHTPHRNGPKLLSGRTNLDTLAWRSGRLVIGVFDDDKPGGPADLIEVLR